MNNEVPSVKTAKPLHPLLASVCSQLMRPLIGIDDRRLRNAPRDGFATRFPDNGKRRSGDILRANLSE